MSEELQARVDELERRLFNQSMQLARLHTSFKRLFNAVPDMALPIAEYNAATAALDACEADGDTLVADLRMVLELLGYAHNAHGEPFEEWIDEAQRSAIARLEAIAT